MAFPSSYIPGSTLRDQLKAAITLNIGGSGPDTLNIALYNASFAGGVQVDDPAKYNVGSYAANEVTGTGWSAGGVALTTIHMQTVSTGGNLDGTGSVGVGINFNAANVSQPTTTLSAVAGCVIYDSTNANKYVICAINFGGSFTSSNGTFAVTWGTANTVTSIFYIQLGPLA